MAQFTTNPTRLDPYRNFKFRIRWDGRYVAGISKVSPLTRTTEVVEHRDGGDVNTVHRAPGQSEFAPITLERGVSHDLAFEQWVNKVWDFQRNPGKEASLADFRKDIRIELYNAAGQLALAYSVFRCWPSEYTALPELDANGTAVAIQSMTLQNEGWERDLDIVEPTEQSYDLPGGD